jgi:hypothetical protein
MALPAGLTCSECHHLKRCLGFGVTKPENDHCDWDPSRFAFSLSRASAYKEALVKARNVLARCNREGWLLADFEDYIEGAIKDADKALGAHWIENSKA